MNGWIANYCCVKQKEITDFLIISHAIAIVFVVDLISDFDKK